MLQLQQKSGGRMDIKFLSLFFLIFLAMPIASAIQITEIMYNPEGADKDREWIELFNDGGSPVDLTGWKLREDSIKHSLVLKQGEATLQPGAYAIIAANDVKFLQENTYSRTLFDSSFYLSNSGEELKLLDSALNETYVITYPTGVDEGNTICLISGAWSPCNPTPGVANEVIQKIEPPGTANENKTVSDEIESVDKVEDQPEEIKDKILVEILSSPEEVGVGEELTISVKLTNKFLEDKTFDLQSYIYSGSSVKTEGGWSGNKQSITLKSDESKEVDLTNKINSKAEAGDYDLRVRVKLGTKTYDANSKIKITEAETAQTDTETEEEEKITGNAIKEEPKQETSSQSKTIYVNKNSGNINKAALIFIIILVITVVFLLISLRK